MGVKSFGPSAAPNVTLAPSRALSTKHESTDACRKPRPRSSSGMLVLVQNSAEAVSSVYVEVGDLCAGEWFGNGAQGHCLIFCLVGPVEVVVQFELAERMAQMALVPDERAVQQFVAADGRSASPV